MFRIGQGFDVHPLVAGRACVIGAVEIPYSKGLLGHSDADVLLHAVIDALLGAAGMGDIGQLFPDTNLLFKDADSRQLLAFAWEKIQSDGFTIGNIDCTILAEQPQMTPYVEKMKQNIATTCQIEPQQVNIKATTMEQLGFIGKEEGIGAIAIALLQKKKQKED